MERLNLGIIGAGGLTVEVMNGIRDLSLKFDNILFYSHRYDPMRVKLHRERFIENSPEYKDNLDFIETDKFFDFMDKSDVIIMNAGRTTPKELLNGVQPVDHLDDLESILEHEVRKNCSGPANFDKKFKSYIQTYNIIKEVKSLKDAGIIREPLRTSWLLPGTLPIVMEYAQLMKEYFEQSPSHPKNKFLIMNSNSSENNLNGVLSIIPEFKESAVSLAIDRNR